MAKLTRKLAFDVSRRILFMAVLLLIGPITMSIAQYVQTPNAAAGLLPVGTFAWGMNSIRIVLAIWLVLRIDLWSSWRGWLRVATYIFAYTYGQMLASASQDWWINLYANFRFPGGQFEDYARPAIDLLELLTWICLLAPIVILSGFSLTGSAELKRTNRFSISALSGFTTAAAIVLLLIAFLTSDFAPLTAYSHLSYTDFIKEWIETFLSYETVPLIAAVVILYGLSKRWSLGLLAFLAVIALDGLGRLIVLSVEHFMTGQHQNILGGNPIDRWLSLCGCQLTIFCAFSIAMLMGIRPGLRSHKIQTIAAGQCVAPDFSATRISDGQSGSATA